MFDEFPMPELEIYLAIEQESYIDEKYLDADGNDTRVWCSCCGELIDLIPDMINHCPKCYEPTCDNCCEGLDDLFYGYCSRCY